MNNTGTIKAIMSIILCGCLVFSSAASAQAAVSMKSECESATLVTEAVIEAYEASAVSQMAGRAGSSTLQGAKGIAFEVLYKDMKNLENFFCIFKPAERFSLSASSTDELADVIVTNKDASVIRFIQCKDGVSDSQIRKILQQVLEGKYENADLVGTKECAAEFNRMAAAKGIEAKMIDSGISTKVTKRIAEKAVGGKITALVKSAGKCGCVGGVLSAAFSAIESVVNGDTVPQTMGNVSIDALEAFVSDGGAAVAGNIVAMGFAIFEAPKVVTIVGALAAAIAVGNAIMAGVEKISSLIELKEHAAKAYDALLKKTGDFFKKAGKTIKKFGKKVAKKTKKAVDSAGKSLAKTGDSLKANIGGWFQNED